MWTVLLATNRRTKHDAINMQSLIGLSIVVLRMFGKSVDNKGWSGLAADEIHYPDWSRIMFHNFSIARFHGLASSIISVLACLTILSFSAPVFSEYYNPKTDWMVEGLYGIHFKYLNDTLRAEVTPAQFNIWIDAFDAVAFAEDIEKTGASWVLWPLGRTWYNSPNATLENLVGDFTSDRDLPLDIYAELKKRGIRMMLYITCDKGHDSEDLTGKVAMGWYSSGNTSHYTQAFVDNWATAMQVWSDRYETKVSGWWVDHCRTVNGPNYSIPIIPDGETNPVIRTYWEALSSGNPDAVFAWNRETGNHHANTPEDDYTSGHRITGATFASQLHNDRWRDGLQWHFMFPISGGGWGQGGTRYSDQALLNFFTSVKAIQGAITVNMFIYKTPNQLEGGVIKTPGHLDDRQLRQMATLKTYKDSVTPNDDCQ